MSSQTESIVYCHNFLHLCFLKETINIKYKKFKKNDSPVLQTSVRTQSWLKHVCKACKAVKL